MVVSLELTVLRAMLGGVTGQSVCRKWPAVPKAH